MNATGRDFVPFHFPALAWQGGAVAETVDSDSRKCFPETGKDL
jgi:hypothetical protein